MAISVLEWQNGDTGKRDWDYFIMMKNFAYYQDPLFVAPNMRGSGFYLKLMNRMGLSFVIEGEFYCRLNDVQVARPGQNIDDIAMPYAQESPNAPGFPHNINAREFQMPSQPNPSQLHLVIQPPVAVEIAPERENGQDFDQNGQNVNMSADINQTVNIPIEPPRDNKPQDQNTVPIEPMPLIEEEISTDEEDRNIELIFVEENILDN